MLLWLRVIALIRTLRLRWMTRRPTRIPLLIKGTSITRRTGVGRWVMGIRYRNRRSVWLGWWWWWWLDGRIRLLLGGRCWIGGRGSGCLVGRGRNIVVQGLRVVPTTASIIDGGTSEIHPGRNGDTHGETTRCICLGGRNDGS